LLTWLLRVLAVAVTAIVLAVTGGGPAAAHTGLETSAPADGEALTAAPERLSRRPLLARGAEAAGLRAAGSAVAFGRPLWPAPAEGLCRGPGPGGRAPDAGCAKASNDRPLPAERISG
jgi:hypothetical protein